MRDAQEVEITGIAAGGAGVGRLQDGRAVFVHRTAPGETAVVRVVQARKRWARADLLRVLQPAPERRDAPCAYYARCGGCTLEHLEYPAQLAVKARIVADALRRIGKLEVETPEVVGSPTEFRYRNRVAFRLRRLGGGRVIAGFHELSRPDRILDIGASCLLPEPAIARAWSRLRDNWGGDACRLPAGEELRLTLRGTAEGAVALLVEGGYGNGRPMELMAAVPELVAIWHAPGGADGPLRRLAGAELLTDRWMDEDLSLSGAAFMQVNRGAAALLEEYVASLVAAAPETTIVDGYCGVGVRARRFARAGATVVGIEMDEAAIQEAERTAVPGTRFVAARVEDALAEHLPADLVLLNPPRGGVETGVAEALKTRRVPRIVYVSCDPATLARDLAALDGYEIVSIRCFDLFPQTAHVETVVELRCATS